MMYKTEKSTHTGSSQAHAKENDSCMTASASDSLPNMPASKELGETSSSLLTRSFTNLECVLNRSFADYESILTRAFPAYGALSENLYTQLQRSLDSARQMSPVPSTPSQSTVIRTGVRHGMVGVKFRPVLKTNSLASFFSNCTINGAPQGVLSSKSEQSAISFLSVDVTESYVSQKKVGCFSAMAQALKRDSGRTNKKKYSSEKSIKESIRVEMDRDPSGKSYNTPVCFSESSERVFSTVSSSSQYKVTESEYVEMSSHKSSEGTPFTSSNLDKCREENIQSKDDNRPECSDYCEGYRYSAERGDDADDGSCPVLGVFLEHLTDAHQLRVIVFGDENVIQDKTDKPDHYIAVNICLKSRNRKILETVGKFQEKVVELNEEVLFNKVKTKTMKCSEVHVFVILTDGYSDTVPIASIKADCRDCTVGDKNIFPIPLIKYN